MRPTWALAAAVACLPLAGCSTALEMAAGTDTGKTEIVHAAASLQQAQLLAQLEREVRAAVLLGGDVATHLAATAAAPGYVQAGVSVTGTAATVVRDGTCTTVDLATGQGPHPC